MLAHMTLEQAELLATLTSSLRPDWGMAGILKALEPLASTIDAKILALALLHAANDPTNESPAILKYPGPHWDRAKAATRSTTHQPTPAPAKTREKPPYRPRNADTSPMCANHPELHEWECKTCNIPAPPPPNFREMIEAARQERLKERTPPGD